MSLLEVEKNKQLNEPPTCPDRKNLSNATALSADSQ
jgi:hypothetical protein